ncbi:dehydrogenase [bacterium]|nr:dehydrogenase [bacterium]
MLIRTKAPLRLGLAGGGTDVSPYCDEYGGMILNATIDMHTFCTIEPLDNDKIIFEAIDLNTSVTYELSEKIEIDGVLDLHKGVYNRIVGEFNAGKPLSFKMTTLSDAPAGSGLGTSSTMVVGMVSAFADWLRLPLGDYDLAHLAYEIERLDLGLRGGKQDQYAATFGGFNFMEFYKNDRVIVNPLRIKSWIIDELESSMVLFYTGASRESAKIIDEQIANTKQKNQQAINAMHELKLDASLMKEAILRGDISSYADLLGKSWLAKKNMANSISTPVIEEAYDQALGSGAIAGKVSGAGGGGFMMFVVDPLARLNVIRELNKLDGTVMNFHFTKYGVKGWRI